MIDESKKTVKGYTQTAQQKASEATDAVIENKKIQAAARKLKEAADAVSSNEMVQTAGQKVQEAGKAIAADDHVQAVAKNEHVQAAGRKVKKVSKAVAENVQGTAQKLEGRHDIEDRTSGDKKIEHRKTDDQEMKDETRDDQEEYKELFEKTNLVPTEREKARGAVNLKKNPPSVIGITQPEKNIEEEKALKYMKDITKVG